MWAALQRKIRFWQHPAASNSELILDRQRVYILPSRAGLVFGVILLAIFIASINYNLSLGYALDFILISCGWLAINFTFRNLSGLGLECHPSQAVFLGELAHFKIHLNNRAKFTRYAIFIGFDKTSMQDVDIPTTSTHNMTLASKPLQRGLMTCPRIRVQTAFPFGLLTTWSYWQSAQQLLVFPRPEKNPPPLPYSGEGNQGEASSSEQDELSGVRNYQPGDSLKHLAWRQMAKQSGGDNDVLLSKHVEGGQKRLCLLSFSALPDQLGLEQKLSRLCAWVLMAEQEKITYAFELGAVRLKKNSGEAHQQACLTALALYG